MQCITYKPLNFSNIDKDAGAPLKLSDLLDFSGQ